jgi:hypothetical protein
VKRLVEGHWLEVKDGDRRALALYRRHYSARRYRDGRKPALFVGPGEKMVLLTVACDALFVSCTRVHAGGRKLISMDDQDGVNCAVFRNESGALSSDLIREAVGLAWARWPGERLYTYVNPAKVKSTNPGYCFQVADWHKCGLTKGGLVVLELLPPAAARERAA